jgi:HTH-type transcriptional repressor of NAD biosynthesis genes
MKSTFRSPNDGGGLTARSGPSATDAHSEASAPRVAILGAEKTGKTWLAKALAPAFVLVAPGWSIADTTPLLNAALAEQRFNDTALYPMALVQQAQFDVTLLMGLDGAWLLDPQLQADAANRSLTDTLLRQALNRAGLAFHVVYGQGPQRLNNALLALGLPSQDLAASKLREQAQFAIHQGRTVWQCNDCSDPDCEHRLFTGLLGQR